MSTPAAASLRVGFFLSLSLGHRTQYLNWRRVLEGLESKIAPSFFPLDNGAHGPLVQKLPLLSEGLRRTATEWSQIRAGFRRGPFDAVFFNPQSLAMKHEKLLRGQPYFFSLDSTRRQFNSFHPWFRRAPGEEGLAGRFRLRRQQRILQSAAKLFPCSQWCADSLIGDYKVDPVRVAVVPLGIDPELWRPAPKPQDGVMRLLFVGGDFERKGGDLLLRWARQTSRKNWELHLVTRNPREAVAGVHYHAASNNSAELIALANRCNLFVLPTRADCSPLSMLEAMSLELPGLSTRVGGVSELIVEGKTGHLIPPDNYDALHAGLDRLLDAPEPLVAMGRAARARVIVEFNAQTNIRRALDMIEAGCR